MEVLGNAVVPMRSSSVTLMSSGPTLASLEVCHSLRMATATSAKPLLSVRCVRRQNKRINAVLMEPTGISEGSLLEFGRLSDDLNPTASPAPSQTGKSASPFSVTVGEALTSHAKHKKARSVEEMERMRREMIPLHELRQGGFVENCLMYRQIFVIRSYEVGADKSSSIDTIFSLFQEVALCHVQLLGIAGDGFGATRAMNRLGLIWVVTRMQVEVDRFPEWPEVIEIDSWVGHAGKNGMRRDWVTRCYQTGEVLARATSTWCMMHATTRRLSKIPDEVRAEIEPCFMDNRFAFHQDEVSASRIAKLNDETTQHLSSQLKSCRGDLDMNQHVNNLKYISWVLESVPAEHIATHKLTSMTLEYRRECQSSDIVESLTSSKTVAEEPIHITGDHRSSAQPHANGAAHIANTNPVAAVPATGFWDLKSADLQIGAPACQFTHLLRTQDAGQQEILRGRTTWRPRSPIPASDH